MCDHLQKPLIAIKGSYIKSAVSQFLRKFATAASEIQYLSTSNCELLEKCEFGITDRKDLAIMRGDNIKEGRIG